jgi:hypothetical protein
VKDAREEMRIIEGFASSRHIIDAEPFNKLKLFKNMKLSLFSFLGDEEAREFCLTLRDELHSVLGWKSSNPDIEWPGSGCGSIMGGNGAGVLVSGPDNEFVQALAKAISEASGVPVTILPPVRGDEMTRLYIAAKAPGFFQK